MSAAGDGQAEAAGGGQANAVGGGQTTWAGVDGVRQRVVFAGPQDSPEAVVFVHGNPGSADDWRALARACGQLLRAVALDLPDFGQTQAPGGFGHTVADYAVYLDRALRALEIERVHLVAHDFGGPIALVWAAGHAERLVSVTLIDTGILPGYKWHRMAKVWRTPLLGELSQALAYRGGFRRMVAAAEPRGLPREFLDNMYDHYDRRTRRAVLRLYRSVDDPGAAAAEFAAWMAQRDVPALVVWGERDAYLPSSYAARQRDAFPSAEVHVLPDSGHWPFIDKAEEVERLLLAHLERCAGPR
jgi:pimeloyl-ACP methyl ester carboxylesterase